MNAAGKYGNERVVSSQAYNEPTIPEASNASWPNGTAKSNEWHH